jgi:hypothetical protein
VALAGQKRFLLLEEGLEIMLGDLIDEPFEPTAIIHPGPDGVVEGFGNVGGLLSALGAGVEIQSRMLLAALAPAVRLAAGAVSQHQRAAEKGIIGQAMSGARAGVPFRDRALSP